MTKNESVFEPEHGVVVQAAFGLMAVAFIATAVSLSDEGLIVRGLFGVGGLAFGIAALILRYRR